MKTCRFLFVILLAFIVLAPFFSCKNKPETIVESSPLVGQWKGTTWQNKPITISVSDVNAKPFITLYDFIVKNDSGTGPDSLLQLTRSSSNGMGPVVNNRFSVPIANVNANIENVNGTFDPTKMSVSGNITVIFRAESDTVRGTFAASKQK